MTRHCTITKKASNWLSVDCHVYDKECLRLYMRCELINYMPDLTEVYRRGPMTVNQYAYEVSTFLYQVQKFLAENDFEKRVADFDLSFDF